MSYINRGNVRRNLKDNQGALADDEQALRLSPNSALTYFHRGNSRAVSGDKPGRIADLQKAIELAQAQDNQQLANSARQNLRTLQP
jgi:tetratricopeptide (TPR) repeat protein